jgi:hypothetical protein
VKEDLTPVDPIELTTPEQSGALFGYACPRCMVLYDLKRFGDEAKTKASECCGPRKCAKDGCDVMLPRIRSSRWCDAHWKEVEAEGDARVYDKAQKVRYADYTGDMFYDDEGEEYHTDLGDMLDEYMQNGRVPPTHVWATEKKTLSLDINDILEQLEDEFHEGAFNAIPEDARKEVQTALDAFCERAAITSYFPDMSVAVHLPSDEVPYRALIRVMKTEDDDVDVVIYGALAGGTANAPVRLRRFDFCREVQDKLVAGARLYAYVNTNCRDPKKLRLYACEMAPEPTEGQDKP